MTNRSKDNLMLHSETPLGNSVCEIHLVHVEEINQRFIVFDQPQAVTSFYFDTMCSVRFTDARV